MVFLVGCGQSNPHAQTTAQSYYYVDSDQQDKSGNPTEDPSKVAPADESIDLGKLTAEQKAAADKFQKDPQSPQAKQNFIAATDRLATASMASPDLDRKVKYRQALHFYREVLKVDPKDDEASSNSQLILSIYKQLHKPAPSD